MAIGTYILLVVESSPRKTVRGSVFLEANMNRRLKRLMTEIERRGGLIKVRGEVPDEVAEHFFEEVLACHECRELAIVQMLTEPPIDQILAGRTSKPERQRH